MYDNISIDTTQNVSIDIEKANLGDRLLAFLIDIMIVIVYYIAMLIIFSAALKHGLLDLIYHDSRIWWVIVSVPIYLYHLLFELFNDGQSPGKKAMKLKVVKLDGSELTFGSIILRWIFRLIDMFPFFFGVVAIISIAASKNSQRLGDMVAGTTVIRIKDRVQLQDTVFELIDPDYIPQFPEVKRLTTKDIEIIKQVLNKREYLHNREVVNKLHTKIINILQVESSLPPIDFLKKVVKDFSYFG